MDEQAETGGVLLTVGEGIGGFLSSIPAGLNSLFSGIGAGAGVHGIIEWAAFLIGLSLLVSIIGGLKRGRIVGPVLRGFIGVALMGWAVS
ncbi:MAG: hypothetical protein Cons2KO_10890 [Congregibacter sp.]